MSRGDNSPGISKLAGVFQGMVKKGQNTSLVLDFGEIQSDKSLLTNTYPIPIPKSDYVVCSYCSGRLSTGSRVLVAWVMDDAVVIDKITNAENVF